MLIGSRVVRMNVRMTGKTKCKAASAAFLLRLHGLAVSLRYIAPKQSHHANH